MEFRKLIHIVGCRPNFIKLAPVYRAAKDKFEQIIIHTGQHYDYEMSKVFFDELELPEPNINLNVQEKTHAKQTARMLEKLEDGLLNYDKNVSVVVVYGDTNSTLAGALAAKKLKFKVVHVEGWFVERDLEIEEKENNPETINRNAIDAISDFVFSPFRPQYFYESRTNVGDVMYDQFLWAQDKLENPSDKTDPLNEYILVTIHREENTEPKRFEQIENAIEDLGYVMFWPRHPRVKDSCPIGYLRMLSRIRDAKLVITDSGGVQKEAFWSKVPCITLRQSTEWIKTVQSKWNTLCEPENLVETVKNIKTPETWINPYGDGKAAERIVNILHKEEAS